MRLRKRESDKKITDDFCETFKTKADCTGAMARMIAYCPLPLGVDEDDPRVQQIVLWCIENHPDGIAI